MNTKKRIFISSVQKELELERAAVAAVAQAEQFLSGIKRVLAGKDEAGAIVSR